MSLIYREQNFTQLDVDDVVKFIETLDEKPTLIRKICFLTVEVLQNIIHHSADRNGNTYAYFKLIKEVDNYLIKTGNLIKKEDKKIELSAWVSIDNQSAAAVISPREDRYRLIEASVPVSGMVGYSSHLRALTRGHGQFTMELAGYGQMPRTKVASVLKEFRGY
jgi:hypothetical protein